MLDQLKQIIDEIAEDPTVWTLNRFETEGRIAQALIDAGVSAEEVWKQDQCPGCMGPCGACTA